MIRIQQAQEPVRLGEAPRRQSCVEADVRPLSRMLSSDVTKQQLGSYD